MTNQEIILNRAYLVADKFNGSHGELRFSPTITAYGTTMMLEDIYNEDEFPYWDSMPGTFVHKGKYHGCYHAE